MFSLFVRNVLDVVRRYGVDYDQIWIFDKIHHEINQFCSTHSLREVYIELFDQLDEALVSNIQLALNQHVKGLTIVSARVTKPKIPKHIRKNYDLLEAKKSQLLISHERQKVVAKQAETAKLVKEIEAKTKAETKKIDLEIEKLTRHADLYALAMEEEINNLQRKTDADIARYRAGKQLEANKLKFTEAYEVHKVLEELNRRNKTFYINSASELMENTLSVAYEMVSRRTGDTSP